MKRISAVTVLTIAVLLLGAGCPSAPPESDVDGAPAAVPPAPTDEPDASPADTDDEQPTAADSADTSVPDPDGGSGEMVPSSDDRELDRTDLGHLDNWELTLARNEIFARHGRPFQNEDIRKHFEATGWYSPDEDYTDAWLSLTERKNAAFILKYQELKYGEPPRPPE